MNAPTRSIETEERLSLLSAIAVALKESLDIDDRQARNIAAKTVGLVRQHYRGEALYIARREPADNRERDEAIRRDYDGSRSSREQLMLRWDVRRSMFYEILKERPQTEE
jgi:Mor family transcriptional regulator